MCLYVNSNQSTPRAGTSRRRNVVSCVTVGDSDEEQKSPQKSRNNGPPTSQQQHSNSCNGQLNMEGPHNHRHGQGSGPHGHQNQFQKDPSLSGSNNSLNSSSRNMNSMRDVKPDILTTSYASQKKRLLAKAQSECLIGLKQEPGLLDPAPNRIVESPKHINKNYNQR